MQTYMCIYTYTYTQFVSVVSSKASHLPSVSPPTEQTSSRTPSSPCLSAQQAWNAHWIPWGCVQPFLKAHLHSLPVPETFLLYPSELLFTESKANNFFPSCLNIPLPSCSCWNMESTLRLLLLPPTSEVAAVFSPKLGHAIRLRGGTGVPALHGSFQTTFPPFSQFWILWSPFMPPTTFLLQSSARVRSHCHLKISSSWAILSLSGYNSEQFQYPGRGSFQYLVS